MEKTQKMSKEKPIFILALLIGSTMLIQSAVLIFGSTYFDLETSYLTNIAFIFIGLFFGSGVVPYICLKKQYQISFSDIGIRKFKTLDYIGVISIVLFCIIWYMRYPAVQYSLILPIALHNLIIGFFEEFLFRGCSIYIISKITNNKYIQYVASVLIFVFILHSGGTTTDNLFWRLPISLVITACYFKQSTLWIPIAIHFIYNMLVSI